MTDAYQFLIPNLALSAGILLVFLLRKPVRMAFGAAQAYALWLLPPLVALASFLPPRIIEIVVPADVPPTDVELPAPDGLGQISEITSASRLLDPSEIAAMLWEIAPVIWIGGILLMILWLALSQARFMANVRLGTAGPAVVGLFRPRVITPSDFAARFDEKERDVILDHENVHLRRNDARINAFAALLRCVCWFNPLVHLAAYFLRIDQEMACDAAVIARRPQARRLYADALIKTQLAARPLPLGCYWPPGAEHPLTERIAMLKRKRPGQMRRRAGVALLVTLACGAGLAAWAAIPAQQLLVFERDYAAERQATVAQPAEQVPPPPAKLEAAKPASPPAKPTLELPEVPKPAPAPKHPAAAAMENPAPAPPSAMSRKVFAPVSAPVHVVAERASANDTGSVFIYEGDVQVRYSDRIFRSDKLTAEKRDTPGSDNFIEFNANRITENTETGVMTYEGNVEIAFDGVLLKADRLTSQSTGSAPMPEIPQAAPLIRPIPAPPAQAPGGPTTERPQAAKPAPTRLDLPPVMPPSGARPFAKYFDAEDPVLLRGAIDHVDFDQPRALVWIKGVASRAGGQSPAPELWMAEGGAPDKLTEAMRAALKPGTEIVVRGYNAKDKSCDPACWMNARDVTFADGTKLVDAK